MNGIKTYYKSINGQLLFYIVIPAKVLKLSTSLKKLTKNISLEHYKNALKHNIRSAFIAKYNFKENWTKEKIERAEKNKAFVDLDYSLIDIVTDIAVAVSEVKRTHDVYYIFDLSSIPSKKLEFIFNKENLIREIYTDLNLFLSHKIILASKGTLSILLKDFTLFENNTLLKV